VAVLLRKREKSMKIFIYMLIIITGISYSAKAQDTYVDGYYRNNGTYVQPHYRSAPNNNPSDNYSAQGNINPYVNGIGRKKPPSLNNVEAENSYKSQTYQKHWNNDRPYGSSYKKPSSGM
jgi:hypothetical protein